MVSGPVAYGSPPNFNKNPDITIIRKSTPWIIKLVMIKSFDYEAVSSNIKRKKTVAKSIYQFKKKFVADY
jgi:hypothetical protein